MWKHVIKDPDLKNRINNKLQEISVVLNSQKADAKPALSLFDGEGGKLLFNNYYDELLNTTRSSGYTEEVLVRFFENAGSVKNINLSFGLSGVLWLIDHLKDQKFIDLDEEVFENSSDVVHNELIRLSLNGNFDYMHGAFGLGLYLLQKPGIADQKSLQHWLKLYVAACENSDGKLRRKTMLNVINKDVGYCLGLAHGVPSVILIALKYLQVYEKDELAHEVLEKSINYLLSVKTKTERNFFFPNSIINDVASEGRLAWCYGDLGCALSLLLAGRQLNRPELSDTALKVALSAAERRHDDSLSDADFCHGTAGIAHIFGRFYNYTGLEEFRLAAEYWFSKTLDLATFEDGLAGYKHYYGLNDWQKREKFDVNAGLLEGVAGIGLAMMSGISSREPAWDSCFLLS